MAESDTPAEEQPEAPNAPEAARTAEPAEKGGAEETRSEGSYLRPGEKSAWERWELPAMQSEHVVSRGGRVPVVSEEEVEVQPLSLEELEAIREEARQEGFAEGREAGYREGHEKGREDGAGEMETQAESLRAAIRALAQPLAAGGDDLEDALAVSATEIARSVILAELQAQPDLIRGIARQVVDALAGASGTLRLFLHPDDLALIESDDAAWHKNCELISEPQMTRGGVRAERGTSSTEFTLEQRFREAVSGFVTAAYNPGDLSDPPAQPDSAGAAPRVNPDNASSEADSVEDESDDATGANS